ncbi:MAG: PaaI family thioesterase [Deltaproteobacteria bacterium]|nr:PaaI family thioesterase [Deltaproteobacteria bacterium]
MNRLVAAIPYARLLGIDVEETRDGPECVLPFHGDLIGNTRLPAIHGGVIGSFLELTAILRLVAESGLDSVPRPISVTIDYLRSAGPRETRARGEIFKLGRRIAHVRVIAWQDARDRPVAAANGKFLMA